MVCSHVLFSCADIAAKKRAEKKEYCNLVDVEEGKYN